jgi:histidyl-tRNA synthetase
MGDVVLAELLCEKGLVPARPPRVDVYVVPVGEEMCAAARHVLALLRRAGVRADAPYGAVRVGKALKAADAAGARRAVLVGPDEWREGSVRVKDLVSGEESEVRVEDLA